MNTATCDVCGAELHIGDFPFCPHGYGSGMLGGFREYTDTVNFPTPQHFTSLAQRNRVERAHGLEPTTKADRERITSSNEAARKELTRQQARPESQRARVSAIREALQQHRR